VRAGAEGIADRELIVCVVTAVRKLEFDLLRYLRHESESGTELEPTELELSFGLEDSSLPALRLEPDGIEIRGVIDKMRSEEAGLLVERRLVAAREARLTTATTLGGLTVAFGLLVAAGLLLNSAVVERERERAARTTAQALAAALHAVVETPDWARSLGAAAQAYARAEYHECRVIERLSDWYKSLVPGTRAEA